MRVAHRRNVPASSSSTPLVDAVETELMLRSDGVGNGSGGTSTVIPVISEEEEEGEETLKKAVAGKEKGLVSFLDRKTSIHPPFFWHLIVKVLLKFNCSVELLSCKVPLNARFRKLQKKVEKESRWFLKGGKPRI